MTQAIGGTITYTDSNGLNPRSDTPYSNGYKVHTYTTVGTTSLEVTLGGDVEYLVVAGGGSGNQGYINTNLGGGGGGAGGYRAGTLTLTTGSKTVTVGTGGTFVANLQGTADGGDNSVFDSITVTGGGGGGMQSRNGGDGGSGGGGGGNLTPGGTGVDGQGHQGGTGGSYPSQLGGGGGGGANTDGGNGSSSAGAGGSGIVNAISGTSITYATGGNGAQNGSGAGSVGTPSTGNGGVGGWGTSAGGNGGSGIVIVRYLYITILTVTTEVPTSVTETTCTGNGTISSVLSGHTVNIRGFCYKLASLSGDPTTSDSVVYDNVGGYTTGAYTKQITGLTSGSVYKIRAYCTDDHSTEYGSTVQVMGRNIYPQATGGSITYTDSTGSNPRSNTPYISGYVVHTFIGSGSLNITKGGTIDYLVVGGGGGGGYSAPASGGGGGGGYLSGNIDIASGEKTIIIGGGGNGGVNGTNSSLDTLVSNGGGSGAYDSSHYTGYNGGSGGGGIGDWPSGYEGGSGTVNQGYAGGTGAYYASGNTYRAGGGGGGASQVGFNGSNIYGGNGGQGLTSSISGVSRIYGSGGGGAGYCSSDGTNGTGGTGGTGGGNGGRRNLGTGTPATYYGCGGGGASGGMYWDGGSGYQGIVIIRYLYLVITGPTNISKLFGRASDTLKKVGGIPIENIKSIMGVQ